MKIDRDFDFAIIPIRQNMSGCAQTIPIDNSIN